jgi:hypothetical protein
VPEIDRAKVDAADDAEIARQIADDDAAARAGAAAQIRGLRARTGLSRAAFARRLNVSVPRAPAHHRQGTGHRDGGPGGMIDEDIRLAPKDPEEARGKSSPPLFQCFARTSDGGAWGG